MMRGIYGRVTRNLNETRARLLKQGKPDSGSIVYWMSRDQRVDDNWGLVYARQMAEAAGRGLTVVFTLVTDFLGADIRHYRFMLEGLEKVETKLHNRGVGFHLMYGDPVDSICGLVESIGASNLVVDFDPIRMKRRWQASAAKRLDIPIYEVDAHNIVPCWIASEKQEYGAYTLRPKLKRLLPIYLDEPESLGKLTKKTLSDSTDWEAAAKHLKLDSSWAQNNLKGGEEEASNAQRKFISEKLAAYPVSRNDPNLQGQSNLSPYLHFGQLSPQRLAYEVANSSQPSEAKDAFLEELTTRRELSDNFCYYNPNYDSTKGFPAWAAKTLQEHINDRREYVYELSELESAKTHDPLWNAAQREMVHRGRMHGYLRMYWAKKIMEWSISPEEALSSAIYLNDKYELDGRDPNGYAGCAWSIGGVHDRPWPERPIYGKIRYMSYSGAARKFNVEKYILKYSESGKN